MLSQCIVSDPPWDFNDQLKKMKSKVKRSAVSQYDTMSTEEICSIKINELADPAGCVLVLWVPSSMLLDGIKVAQAWGFKIKQTYVWVKTKKKNSKRLSEDLNDELAFGMGRLFRQTHEIALVCTSGKTVYPQLRNKSQRSVSCAENAGHSTKPENLQDSLDLMFPTSNKIEMFARRSRVGWTCLGNEIDGKDIREAVQELLAMLG